MKPGFSNDAKLEKTKETILANISEIENGLRIVSKMPDEISEKPNKKKQLLLNNLSERIRSLMELITEGNHVSNLPPDPEWIKNDNNKKMLQGWYDKHLIKDANILSKVKEMLKPAPSKAGFTPNYSPKAAPKENASGSAETFPVSEDELKRYLQVQSHAKPGEWVNIKNSEWEVGRGKKSGNLAIANKDHHIELNPAGDLVCHDKSKGYEVSKVNFLRLFDESAKLSIKNNELKLFIAQAVGMQPGQWKSLPSNWEIGVSKFSKNPSISNALYQVELKDNKLVCLDKKNGFKEMTDFNIYSELHSVLRDHIKAENAKASTKSKKSPGM